MSLYITLITITFIACDTKEEMLGDRIGDPMADSVELADFYVGADLSYTSELEKRWMCIQYSRHTVPIWSS